MTYESRLAADLADQQAQDRELAELYPAPEWPAEEDASPTPPSLFVDDLRELAALRREDDRYAMELEAERMDYDPMRLP